MPKGKHSAPGNKPMPKWAKRACIAMAAVLLAVIALILAYSMWEEPPEIAPPAPPQSAEPTEKPVIKGEEEPDEEEVDWDSLTEPLETERNNGVYTFAVVGKDDASNSTDTILVGRMDTVKHTLDVVSIPRDTMINISWSSTPKKINAVYPGYTNSGYSGIDGLKEHLRGLLGFDIDCYAVIDLKAFEDIVDAVGGVYYDVPFPMDYDDPVQDLHIHVDEGYQLLSGYDAMGVFRYRYSNDGTGFPGGDLERIQYQQRFMLSVAKQMLSLGNIPNLPQVLEVLENEVDTDLSAANIAFFIRHFLLCPAENVNFHTPEVTPAAIGIYGYVCLNVEQWLGLVNERLNPYSEDITAANVNILTSNYDGSWLYSTTGYVAGGGIESFAGYVKPSPSPDVTETPAESPETGETPVPDTETPETTQPVPDENTESQDIVLS